MAETGHQENRCLLVLRRRITYLAQSTFRHPTIPIRYHMIEDHRTSAQQARTLDGGNALQFHIPLAAEIW
jgi:hypothetical protein